MSALCTSAGEIETQNSKVAIKRAGSKTVLLTPCPGLFSNSARQIDPKH